MNEQIQAIQRSLQSALEVELFTIPLYLTALYSIREGTNRDAVLIVQGVVMEEMLHMALVSNVMNAIGGAPCLSPDIANESEDSPCRLEIRTYPADVPMIQPPLEIGLSRFSRESIHRFSELEKPREWRGASGAPFTSIGEFYDDIVHRLRAACEDLGESTIFCGDGNRQIRPDTHYYGAGGKVIFVKCLADALEAIEQVTQQGEGRRKLTNLSGNNARFGQAKEAAHHFRFEQILKGRYYEIENNIEADPTGRSLSVDWAAVHPMQDDPPSSCDSSSGLGELVQKFDSRYRKILKLLHCGMNGEADTFLPQAIGEMYRLKYQAIDLMRTPIEGTYDTYGPPFWFVESVPR